MYRFAAPSVARTVRRRHELSLFVAAYGLYTAARWIFVGDPGEARAHALAILELERSVDVAMEGTIQRAFDSGVPIWTLSHVYLAAQLVVLPVALIWLHRRARPVYSRLRTTVIATWLVSLPIYAVFPVAPPRLAGIGITDTVTREVGVPLTGHSTAFFNPYAAVPSLHVGFAFAIGIAAATALRRPWTKTLALLWGPVVTLAVVATGNHYVVDAAAGIVVTGIGFSLAQLVHRSSGPRATARLAREPVAA